MPKSTGLKLFTKTWPLKREKKCKEDEPSRPLTATLEKPTILDIRFIGKIDMSRIRKEFLNISNLCRMPLGLRQKKNPSRPPCILNSAIQRKSPKKKKADPSDDSHEDDESSVVQSAKLNDTKSTRSRSRNSGRLSYNNPVISRLNQNSVLRIKNSVNDANNNNKTLKVPSRKPVLTTIATPPSCPETVKSSTKLPSPCRTCGRPDLPERFHSHPTTPLKLSPKNKGVVSAVILEKTEKLPVKSIVQKPIAIKYKSKSGSTDPLKMSPLKKTSSQASSASVPVVKKSATFRAKKSESNTPKSPPDRDKEGSMNNESVTVLRGGSGKRTLTCYICGREFGTASLPLHEPKCLEKWERENASLPPNMRRKPPTKPAGTVSQQEWNRMAWESSQSSLVPCKNCGRTFYPDRLIVHQKSCKVPITNTKKSVSNDTLDLTSSSSMSQSSDTPSTSTKPSKQPPSVQCYICGRMFGTHSIAIHEKKCLKKWHVENESLPIDMRSPAPVRKDQDQLVLASEVSSPSSSAASSPANLKAERPVSGSKSPLFPCYLCGKLFTVNSIYIHEPQCLKMWKIENDRLPPAKRRPVPLKPDIKFTRTVFSLAFFSKYLKVDDAILGMISCSTKILAAGVYAFAPSSFYFYLGAVVELLNGTSFIAMRAMISKLVQPEELGKINSLFGIGEAIVPLLYGPLYSRIYARTIDTFPGCFYLVGGGLTLPALFIFYWLYLEHKKDQTEVEEHKFQSDNLLKEKNIENLPSDMEKPLSNNEVISENHYTECSS